MTYEEFEEIMDQDIEYKTENYHRNIIKGLRLIEKYDPKVDISHAEHEIVYANTEIEELIKVISIEDAQQLRNMGWIIEEDSLACFT